MIESFRDDNTNGYTPAERDALNQEWAEVCEDLGLEEGTEQYNEAEGHFADTVSRRTPQTARPRDQRESMWTS